MNKSGNSSNLINYQIGVKIIIWNYKKKITKKRKENVSKNIYSLVKIIIRKRKLLLEKENYH
jgi:hypothetical protein